MKSHASSFFVSAIFVVTSFYTTFCCSCPLQSWYWRWRDGVVPTITTSFYFSSQSLMPCTTCFYLIVLLSLSRTDILAQDSSSIYSTRIHHEMLFITYRDWFWLWSFPNERTRPLYAKSFSATYTEPILISPFENSTMYFPRGPFTSKMDKIYPLRIWIIFSLWLKFQIFYAAILLKSIPPRRSTIRQQLFFIFVQILVFYTVFAPQASL